MTKTYAQVTPPSEFIAALLMRIVLQIFQKLRQTLKNHIVFRVTAMVYICHPTLKIAQEFVNI